MLLAKTPESTLFSDSDIIEKRSFGRSSYISCLLKIAKDPQSKCCHPCFTTSFIQWGTNALAIDGGIHSITLPIAISYAICAQVTMLTIDVPDIVLCPYWTGCTTTTIKITTDYETGHSYTGTGENQVSWLLVAI